MVFQVEGTAHAKALWLEAMGNAESKKAGGVRRGWQGPDPAKAWTGVLFPGFSQVDFLPTLHGLMVGSGLLGSAK